MKNVAALATASDWLTALSNALLFSAKANGEFDDCKGVYLSAYRHRLLATGTDRYVLGQVSVPAEVANEALLECLVPLDLAKLALKRLKGLVGVDPSANVSLLVEGRAAQFVTEEPVEGFEVLGSGELKYLRRSYNAMFSRRYRGSVGGVPVQLDDRRLGLFMKVKRPGGSGDVLQMDSGEGCGAIAFSRGSWFRGLLMPLQSPAVPVDSKFFP